MQVLLYPNKLLLQEAQEIGEVDEAVRQLGREMLDTMYAHHGVGLAGPQVGVLKRIVVVNLSGEKDSGEEFVLVNPVIVKRSDELVTRSEGCLSFPGINGPVSRWSRIWVSSLNLDGEEVQIEATGLLSIAFQHEIDHLNGILFVSKLPPASKTVIKSDLNRLKEKALSR